MFCIEYQSAVYDVVTFSSEQQQRCDDYNYRTAQSDSISVPTGNNTMYKMGILMCQVFISVNAEGLDKCKHIL